MLTEQETVLGRGAGGEQEGKGAQTEQETVLGRGAGGEREGKGAHTEQETVLGRGAGGEQEGKGARGTAWPRAHHRGFYGDEISSRVVCGQSF